jgi:hypothetical protein
VATNHDRQLEVARDAIREVRRRGEVPVADRAAFLRSVRLLGGVQVDYQTGELRALRGDGDVERARAKLRVLSIPPSPR